MNLFHILDWGAHNSVFSEHFLVFVLKSAISGALLLQFQNAEFHRRLVELAPLLEEMAFNTSSCSVDGGSESKSVVVDN